VTIVMSHEPLIAIVEDDESFRESVQALLQSAGRRAVTFASAEQFLASGAAATADCLILDLRMPGMDGLGLQRRMRAAGFRIPTIVITAHADDVSRARALAVGAAAFLPKPFQPDVLLQAIETAMRES
jgi:two-component system, LuxR family, response regulator FixJ